MAHGAIVGKAEPMVARKSEVENIHRVRSVRLLQEGVAQIQDKIPDSVAVQTDIKPRVPRLQSNSQETMSCDGTDIGRTSLPKHEIKVGEAYATCIDTYSVIVYIIDLDLDDVVRVALWLKLSLPGGKTISGSMLFTYIYS